jgi:hypothetical protein
MMQEATTVQISGTPKKRKGRKYGSIGVIPASKFLPRFSSHRSAVQPTNSLRTEVKEN